VGGLFDDFLEPVSDAGFTGSDDGVDLLIGGCLSSDLPGVGHAPQVEELFELSHGSLSLVVVEGIGDTLSVVLDGAGDDVDVCLVGCCGFEEGDEGALLVSEVLEVDVDDMCPLVGGQGLIRGKPDVGVNHGLLDVGVEVDLFTEFVEERLDVFAFHVGGEDLRMVLAEVVLEDVGEGGGLPFSDAVNHGSSASVFGPWRRVIAPGSRCLWAARTE